MLETTVLAGIGGWVLDVVYAVVQAAEWDPRDPLRTAAIVRMFFAALFGGLLGWERGRADKPADIRTMILISTGAAAFTMLGSQIIASADNDTIIRAGPTRVVSYIISGVGFLGAGAILHSKRTIKGLTTAASVWVVAAIGSACGVGEISIAFMLFAFAYVTLWTPWVLALMRGNLDSFNTNGDD